MEVPTERMNLPGDFLQEHEDIKEKAKCSPSEVMEVPQKRWMVYKL